MTTAKSLSYLRLSKEQFRPLHHSSILRRRNNKSPLTSMVIRASKTHDKVSPIVNVGTTFAHIDPKSSTDRKEKQSTPKYVIHANPHQAILDPDPIISQTIIQRMTDEYTPRAILLHEGNTKRSYCRYNDE